MACGNRLRQASIYGQGLGRHAARDGSDSMSQLVLRQPAVSLETEQPAGWIAINTLLALITESRYGRPSRGTT